MSNSCGRPMPIPTAAPVRTTATREAGRGPVRRQQPHGADHDEVDDGGPEQPPHPAPIVAVRPAEPAHDHGERHHQAERDERVGDGQQRAPDAVRQRDRRRIEVQAGVRRGQRVRARRVLREPGGREQQHDGKRGRRGEARDRRHPPPAARQPPVGVEQQHHRQRQQQGRAEPLVDPEREAGAGQRRAALRGVDEPRRGGAVERPVRSGDAQHPGHGVPGEAAQQQRAGDGQRDAGQPGDPAGFGGDGLAVGGVDVGVEDRRAHHRGDRDADGERAGHPPGASRVRDLCHAGHPASRGVPRSGDRCPVVAGTSSGTGFGARDPAARVGAPGTVVLVSRTDLRSPR